MTTDEYVTLVRETDPDARIYVRDNGWVTVVSGPNVYHINPEYVMVTRTEMDARWIR